MTTEPQPASPVFPASGRSSAAKARLLGWADEHDARPGSGFSGVGRMIGGGVAAALAGALISRALSSHRSGGRADRGSRLGRLVSWALLIRAGSRFLPHILAAVNRAPAGHTDRRQNPQAGAVHTT